MSRTAEADPRRTPAQGRCGAVSALSDGSEALAYGNELGGWLLALYRDCRVPKPDEFCEWALERLKRVVDFDSASWGHGHASPIVIHDVHLHRQSPDKAEAYARYKHDDYLFPEVIRRPGESIDMYGLVPRVEHVRRPIYKGYARPFGGEHVLCTALPQQGTGLVHFLNLWRADFAQPFSAGERAFKQQVMPHLVEARRLNVFEHIRRTSDPAPAGARAAVCDPLGTLHESEEGFAEVLGAQWPGWSGPMLPDVLCARLRRREVSTLRVGSVGVSWSPLGTTFLMRAWRLGGVDRLSPREGEVARLLVEGHEHKAIARMLGVEPTTIRSQIHAIYRKLGTANRAQMVSAWLSAGGQRAGGVAATLAAPLSSRRSRRIP